MAKINEERLAAIIALREQGFNDTQIADFHESTREAVAAFLTRARRIGYEIPDPIPPNQQAENDRRRRQSKDRFDRLNAMRKAGKTNVEIAASEGLKISTIYSIWARGKKRGYE